MARELGKTYHAIEQAVLDAVSRGQETPVLWASPETAKRLREVADMMGIKVEIKVGYKENFVLKRK